MKSVVRTSVCTLAGGIATLRAYGLVAFLSWWLTVMTYLRSFR